MKFKTVTGREVNKNISKWLINWDGKSLSKPQFLTKQFLKKYWWTHIVVEEMPVWGSRMHCDIIDLSIKVSIEVDGEMHGKCHPHFHGKGPEARIKFLASIKRDEDKRIFLENNGITCCRIPDYDVKNLSVKYFKDNFDIDLI